MEPFCWLSRDGLRKIRTLDERDRKAARLLYLALAEMAAERFDGDHSGFEATGGEVLTAVDLSRPTLYQARDSLVRLGLLAVSGTGNDRVWTLLPAVSTQMTPGVNSDDTGSRVYREKKEEVAPSEPSVSRIFEAWRSEVPHRQGARLTAGRRAKIKARLKTFPEPDLVEAIRFVAREPFYNGENDRGQLYSDFGTIFRNDEKVENLLLEARRPRSQTQRNGTGSNGNRAERNVDQAKRWLNGA